MQYKTDYKGIHERAYQTLRKEGRNAWSQFSDITYRVNHFAHQISETGFSTQSARILVLGSGDGEVSIGLSKLGFRVVGIDISPTAVAWASEKAAQTKSNANFIEGNVLDLKRIEKTFSVMIDDHCFHCIIGKDRSTFLEGAFERLEPRGILILRTQCGDPPSTESDYFLRMWNVHTRCQVYNGVAGRYFGLPSKIIEEVSAAGFNTLSTAISRQQQGWNMLEVLAQKP